MRDLNLSTPQVLPEQGSVPPELTPVQRIEHAHDRVRFAARMISISEGQLLDYETADEINQALHRAQRDLEEVKAGMATPARTN